MAVIKHLSTVSSRLKIRVIIPLYAKAGTFIRSHNLSKCTSNEMPYGSRNQHNIGFTLIVMFKYCVSSPPFLQAISGVRCTRRCRESIKLLRNSTTRLNSFDSCICDGADGPFCSDIRKNIKRLCDDGENSRIRTFKKKNNPRRPNFEKDSDFDKRTHRSNLNRKNALNTAASSVVLHGNFLVILIVFLATRYSLWVTS